MCRGLQSRCNSPAHSSLLSSFVSASYVFPGIGLESAFMKLPLRFRGNGEKMTGMVGTATVRRRKHSMLPLLLFLFVLSYGLLTTLLVLQDHRIDAQNDLIHLLFKVNRQLTVIASARKTHVPPQSKPGSQTNAHVQIPSSQVGKTASAQVSASATPKAAEIPLSQEKKLSKSKPGRTHHQGGRRSPFQPPHEITDPSDMRRALFSI